MVGVTVGVAVGVTGTAVSVGAGVVGATVDVGAVGVGVGVGVASFPSPPPQAAKIGTSNIKTKIRAENLYQNLLSRCTLFPPNH
jgi:hypothetical protein